MSTRIRYSKGAGVLKSVKQFQHPTNGGRFSIEINPLDNGYTVKDEIAEIVVASGNAKTLSRAKIAAKEALANLGISFESETRTKEKIESV
jgi:hypothetical protein